ncbi:ferredoxin [Geodermatophilus sabuli]|uniref:Ferredoxin n=1 Tax=Geodermatophilus sabuli TaxID=1564158 RepID=A0A7K3W0N7_9ACTN|nr:ferredoxin [Geodermatophilus sabuli]NEK58439.1 ferredoxin [Geodermatophilus sabuli]
MPHTVSVDKEICISSGKCVADAPAVFRFDDDELAEAVDPTPTVDDGFLVAVARNCPSGAITVYGGQGEPIDLD